MSVQIFRVDCRLVRALDLGQLRVSLQSLRNLNVKGDLRRLGNVKLDECSLKQFRQSILAANAQGVARETRNHTGSIEVARKRRQVAQGHLLHDHVRTGTAANILLLQENIQHKLENLSAFLLCIIALNVGVNDQLVFTLGESHRAECVSVATKFGASNTLRFSTISRVQDSSV